MKVAVLGAAGAVGQELWRLLEESSWPNVEAVPYTTARSQGKPLSFRGGQVLCRELTTDTLERVDLVLASAGAATSKEWTPRFAQLGAVVVDNSSEFRMDPQVPLVVPEINAHLLTEQTRVVANPNCSTIQMVVALAPLHARWDLCAVRVSTYQAVSGAGSRAVREMVEGTEALLEDRDTSAEVFPHPIAFNAIPHVGSFDDSMESGEEIKIREESRRIMDLPNLLVSATCVRIPVFRGHSEAVWATFRGTPDAVEARALLKEHGVEVVDDPTEAQYPVPRSAAGMPGVYVGRIRPDHADPRGLCMWIVSDNLLKGAATNAMQIAKILMNKITPSLGRAT